MSWNVRSVILLIGAVQGLTIAGLLLLKAKNRIANAFLAALMMVVVLSLTPQIIGFGGFYHRYPWLTFAPFNLTLALGPLIYLYIATLIFGRPPKLWHLAPAAVQFCWYCFLFAQDMETKSWFAKEVVGPYTAPVESVIMLGQVAVYLTLSLRLYRRHQGFLQESISDLENYRLPWLRNFLVAVSIGAALLFSFEIVDLIVGLSYVQIFPMYVGFALLLYYLGVEGYRHAELAIPPLVETKETEPNTPASNSKPAPEPTPDPEPESELIDDVDIRFARDIAERVQGERWYLEPTLTLQELSRRMASNPTTLSRAINRGLGANFNEFVNRYRVAAVKTILEDPNDDRDVLQIALDCGFNSKTSFNRQFKALTGVTPLAYRRSARTKS